MSFIIFFQIECWRKDADQSPEGDHLVPTAPCFGRDVRDEPGQGGCLLRLLTVLQGHGDCQVSM